MPREFIAAIELGSSKITGIAGRKNMDGSISVLQVVKEPTNGCIKRGVVYNIDKTETLLKSIITKLSHSLQCEIKCVYVGAGGQSIRSIRNVVNKTFDTETTITQEMVDELMDSNRAMHYPEQEFIDQAIQEYKVDQQYQTDPVGIQCKRLEGNYLNILWRKTFYRKLNQCFQDTGIRIAEMYLAPLMLAKNILTESERRNGCLLVDLGAETTTVAVYYRNILRHLAVIPLGSDNVNKDLTTLQMDDAEAETMKLKYSYAYVDEHDANSTLEYPINHERSIPVQKFDAVVEGRMAEIIVNVWNQVPSEYAERLLGGIILTGGGANMKNIVEAFRYHTQKDKIRIARTVMHTIDSNHPDITAEDATMNTILALLSEGENNCAGKELSSTQDIFNEEPKKEEEVDEPVEPRDPSKKNGGVIITQEEKDKIEEERLRKIQEEEARLEELRQLQEAERRKKKENSLFNRFKKSAQKLLKTIVEEEKEEN